MKKCLACNTQYSTIEKVCPECASRPEMIDGFEAYAPDLANAGGGFKADYFSVLVDLEDANFWFRGRNKIIIWALHKYAKDFTNLLEIGCGTGFVLSGVARAFPSARLSGSEIFTNGLQAASTRLSSVNLIQVDARQIPFVDEFDVIGAFDVLEHIKEDDVVLQQIEKALKPKGITILTVPQHAWLWSAADEYALHERRYSASEIEEKVTAAGLKILRSTSFVSSLLPAMMISRVLQKPQKENYDPTDELKIHSLLNSLFETLLAIELKGIQLGLNYPVGGSRLIVAQKQ